MRKVYLKDVQSVLALKDTDTKIYDSSYSEKDTHYEFVNGVLCRFDSKENKWQANVSIWSEEKPYILEEEPMQEATEEDVGKLCWFWSDEDSKRSIGILTSISQFGGFEKDKNGYWRKHCRRLSPAEVAEITGYKVEEK